MDSLSKWIEPILTEGLEKYLVERDGQTISSSQLHYHTNTSNLIIATEPKFEKLACFVKWQNQKALTAEVADKQCRIRISFNRTEATSEDQLHTLQAGSLFHIGSSRIRISFCHTPPRVEMCIDTFQPPKTIRTAPINSISRMPIVTSLPNVRRLLEKFQGGQNTMNRSGLYSNATLYLTDAEIETDGAADSKSESVSQTQYATQIASEPFLAQTTSHPLSNLHTQRTDAASMLALLRPKQHDSLDEEPLPVAGATQKQMANPSENDNLEVVVHSQIQNTKNKNIRTIDEEIDISSSSGIEFAPLKSGQPTESLNQSPTSSTSEHELIQKAGTNVKIFKDTQIAIPLDQRLQNMRLASQQGLPLSNLRWTRTISKAQAKILSTEDAYQPPLVGRPSRLSSIPLQILTKLTSEIDMLCSKQQTESTSCSTTPNTKSAMLGKHDQSLSILDHSPQVTPEEKVLSTQREDTTPVNIEREDEEESVDWSPSPTPVRTHKQLPPDSPVTFHHPHTTRQGVKSQSRSLSEEHTVSVQQYKQQQENRLHKIATSQSAGNIDNAGVLEMVQDLRHDIVSATSKHSTSQRSDHNDPGPRSTDFKDKMLTSAVSHRDHIANAGTFNTLESSYPLSPHRSAIVESESHSQASTQALKDTLDTHQSLIHSQHKRKSNNRSPPSSPSMYKRSKHDATTSFTPASRDWRNQPTPSSGQQAAFENKTFNVGNGNRVLQKDMMSPTRSKPLKKRHTVDTPTTRKLASRPISAKSSPLHKQAEVSHEKHKLKSLSFEKSSSSATVKDDLLARFRIQYPEYAGQRKHFAAACELLRKLVSTNMKLHPFLWDDFVYRHFHDYRQYLRNNIEEGKDALPYDLFYYEHVQAPTYIKGVVKPADLESLTGNQDIDPPSSPSLAVVQDLSATMETSPKPSSPILYTKAVDNSVSNKPQNGGSTSNDTGSPDCRTSNLRRSSSSVLPPRRSGAESPELGTPQLSQKSQGKSMQSPQDKALNSIDQESSVFQTFVKDFSSLPYEELATEPQMIDIFSW